MTGRASLPTFTGLLRNTAEIFHRYLAVVAVPSVTYFLVQTAISVVMSSFTVKHNPGIMGPVGFAMSNNTTPWNTQLLWTVVPSLISFWVAIVYMLWLIRGIQHRKDGVRDTPDHVEYAVRMSVPWIATSLLIWVITFGTGGFFLIPGIIFGVWYWLSAPVLVYEGTWGLPVMARSRTLTQGLWGNVFSYGLFLWAIAFVWGIILMFGFPWVIRVTQAMSFPYLVLSPVTVFFSMLINVFSVTFKTVVYEALRRVHKPARTQVVPEVAGLGLAALSIVAIAFLIGFGLPRLIGALEKRTMPQVGTSTVTTSYPTPSKRLYRMVGSAPAAEIAKDKNVVKNFHMINRKIQAYFFQYKVFPDQLPDLVDKGYIQGSVPTNGETGQPFFYTRERAGSGVRDGYRFCPTADSTRERCYFQTEYE